MDSFNEYIVKRSRDSKAKMIFLATLVGGILLCFLTMILIFTFIPILGSVSLLFVAGIIYGMYYIISNQNIEYEYIVTNGELDVDKIIAKRRRKRIVSISSKEFEIFADVAGENSDAMKQNGITVTIDASSGLPNRKKYFAIFRKGSEKILLIFEPTEKMVEDFKKFVPRSKFFA